MEMTSQSCTVEGQEAMEHKLKHGKLLLDFLLSDFFYYQVVLSLDQIDQRFC